VGKGELIKGIIEQERVLNRVIRQYDPGAWMGLSLTIAQIKSLFFISNEGEANFRKLAAALKVTPSNVTGIIDRLVEQELVTRTENPEDRRMLMLKLTEKGETLIANLRERRVSQMSSILQQMTDEELSAIALGFSLLQRAIETYQSPKSKISYSH
jgi:MarR family transcriptional regulator, organic hydroperoxide resistance regulator